MKEVIELANYWINSDKYHYKDEPYEEINSFRSKEDALEFCRRYNEKSQEICGYKLKFLVTKEGQVYTHRWCVLVNGELNEDYYNTISKDRICKFNKVEKRIVEEIRLLQEDRI